MSKIHARFCLRHCRLDTEARLLTNDELRTIVQEEVAADQREGRTSTTLVQARRRPRPRSVRSF